MKKLRLQLEDLRIDSFTTTPMEKERGTVFGEQCTCYTACTCPGCPSCDASCGGTCASCAASCNGTCDGCTGTVADTEECSWDSCGGGRTCYEYTCYGFQTFGGTRDACEIC